MGLFFLVLVYSILIKLRRCATRDPVSEHYHILSNSADYLDHIYTVN